MRTVLRLGEGNEITHIHYAREVYLPKDQYDTVTETEITPEMKPVGKVTFTSYSPSLFQPNPGQGQIEQPADIHRAAGRPGHHRQLSRGVQPCAVHE